MAIKAFLNILSITNKKQCCVLLICLLLISAKLMAQTYNMSTSTVNACAGTFYDSGGPGANYAINENKTMTFCSDAGNCIKLTFTNFNTETSFDILKVYNGPNTSYALIGSYSGTAIPGPFTSVQGGCITFVFTSDGTTTKPGWVANISCAACPPPPNQDCVYKKPLCGTTSLTDNNGGTGTVVDLNNGNGGCLMQGGQPGEIQSSWYSFTFANAGNFTFDIVPTNGTDDYDFGLWGPNPACPPTALPSRCSVACYGNAAYCGGVSGTASASTGLNTSSTDVTEPPTAPPTVDGYVKDITVAAGDIYIMMVNNASKTNSGFQISFGGTAKLTDCITPIELLDLKAHWIKSLVQIEWETASEINNDHFELEKSADGIHFTHLATMKGAGNSNDLRIYSVNDLKPFPGINFYRLKQINFDGKATYAPMVSVKVPETGNRLISVAPNPLTQGDEELKIEYYALDAYTPTLVELKNILGQNIYSSQLQLVEGRNSFSIPAISTYPQGLYFLEITKDGQTQSQKVIIAR